MSSDKNFMVFRWILGTCRASKSTQKANILCKAVRGDPGELGGPPQHESNAYGLFHGGKLDRMSSDKNFMVFGWFLGTCRYSKSTQNANILCRAVRGDHGELRAPPQHESIALGELIGAKLNRMSSD